MQYRHLGRSGLMVSEIAYGNWITHGSQVEEQAAADCVRAAIDEGITTFDTADVYADGRAEVILGRALAGARDPVIGWRRPRSAWLRLGVGRPLAASAGRVCLASAGSSGLCAPGESWAVPSVAPALRRRNTRLA